MTRSLALAIALLTTSVNAAEGVSSREYAARRQLVASAIGPRSILVMFSAQPARRNGSVEWPYRQNDNLYYLTGNTQPDSALVLLPGEPATSEVLFARERNPQQERWSGRIPSAEELRAGTGIATIAGADGLNGFIAAVLEGRSWSPAGRPLSFADPIAPSFSEAVRRGEAEVWLLMERRPPLDGDLPPVLEYAGRLRARYPEIRFRDATPVLRGLREVKTAAELELMRRAIDITGDAQLAAMRLAMTATNEKQIDDAIDRAYREGGACCWGFPSIVAAGANATTLHYHANDAVIRRGDLVLTDIGADYQGYTADVTRTYPAGGRFTAEQRAVHDAVFRAQEEVIRIARAGNTWRELSDKAHQVLGEELLELGLITRNEPEQVRMYFFHGIGHHVGLQVHDTGRYQQLRPGMVIAIEPGIYVRKDDVLASPTYAKLGEEEKSRVAGALERYNGIGVRIEDNVLVTGGAPEHLSRKAPRSAADIEKFMNGARVSSPAP
ncbi:MAG TPA: Xaa-Pro aminopeptidase [Thermoanaerobaculia bacterium]|nr:Xaa-Pro aminopeptidase [Thermoanaerobaculia bacterium]